MCQVCINLPVKLVLETAPIFRDTCRRQRSDAYKLNPKKRNERINIGRICLISELETLFYAPSMAI